jgi:hypothetical protein
LVKIVSRQPTGLVFIFIYLAPDRRNVIKANDAIYYATWLEFFNSLVIHNLVFEETAYTFLGFTEKAGSL